MVLKEGCETLKRQINHRLDIIETSKHLTTWEFESAYAQGMAEALSIYGFDRQPMNEQAVSKLGNLNRCAEIAKKKTPEKCMPLIKPVRDSLEQIKCDLDLFD